MPSTSASNSSVFGRSTGRRPAHDIPHAATTPPLDERERERSSSNGAPGHKRESSILSLSGSVSDLGHSVRRSVSLRSHRTYHSGSSGAHARYPSSSNLVTSPPLLSPVEAILEPFHLPPAPPPSPPRPTRPRAKLSISARSFSQRFKSTDTLPLLSGPGQPDDPPPPLPSIDPPKTPGMLAAPSAPKRPPPERPSLVSGTSFTREREVSTPYGGPNGGPPPPPLQHTTTASSTLSVATGGHSPSAVYQTIHELSTKRIATIDYMRKVHEGNVFYFGTLHYTSHNLSTMPSLMQHKLGRRATSYMVLGYSLPTLLDMNSTSALDYLKALSALLQEFETYQNLSGFDSSGSSLSRGRVGQMFKSGMGLGARSGKGRRASATTTTGDPIAFEPPKPNTLGLPHSATDTSSPQDLPSPTNPSNHEFHQLLTPHLPFEPDFSATFATLCDTLIDAYGKLLDLVSSPDVCGAGVGEAFAKADKAVRKILVGNVIREFEDTTRAGAKSEIAGLGRLVLGGLM